jgi:hypothetical protein
MLPLNKTKLMTQEINQLHKAAEHKRTFKVYRGKPEN